MASQPSSTNSKDPVEPDLQSIPQQIKQTPSSSEIRRKPVPSSTLLRKVDNNAAEDPPEAAPVPSTGTLNAANDQISTHRSRETKSKFCPSRWRRFRLKLAILSQDSWWPEVFSLALGVACLVALVALLLVFEKKPIRDWHGGITMNAVISIIVTGMDSALALPLASSFGQLKWIAMKRNATPLPKVQQFDSASRSASGRISLLLSLQGGFIGTAGAAIAMLMLAIGPFAQQVVSISLHQSSSSQAVIGRAVNGTENVPEGSHWSGATLPMIAAIVNALLGYSTNGTLPSPPYSCATGNCTWNPFLTLGICSMAVPTGGVIVLGADYVRWMLPNKYFNLSILSIVDADATGFEAMNVTTITDTNRYGSPLSDIILRFAIINSSVYNASEATALDCNLRMCLQKIETRIQNGQFLESTTKVAATWLGASTTYPSFALNEAIWNNQTTFMASPFFLSGVTGALNPFFIAEAAAQGPGGGMYYSTDAAMALWTSDSLHAHMEYLARSMSIHLREPSSGGSDTVSGEASTTESYFKVTWPWLILPVAVVVFVIIFVVAVIVETRRSGTRLWKNSMLAVLFRGFDDSDRQRLATDNKAYHDIESSSGADCFAKGIEVQLRLDERLNTTRLVISGPRS